MKETEDTNSYRDANRLRKVLDLINVLHYAKFDSDTVSKLTDDQWKLVALCASVNPPSEVTRELVVTAMKHAEGLKSKKVNITVARQLVGKVDKRRKR